MIQVLSLNDIYPREQYVSVKLQQVQRKYRLHNHFCMRITSLTPIVNYWNRINKISLNQPSIFCLKKSWHRLQIKEMIKWRPFCTILKRLYVINVWILHDMRKLSFLLEIYSLQGHFVQELWLEIFRRQKT